MTNEGPSYTIILGFGFKQEFSSPVHHEHYWPFLSALRLSCKRVPSLLSGCGHLMQRPPLLLSICHYTKQNKTITYSYRTPATRTSRTAYLMLSLEYASGFILTHTGRFRSKSWFRYLVASSLSLELMASLSIWAASSAETAKMWC